MDEKASPDQEEIKEITPAEETKAPTIPPVESQPQKKLYRSRTNKVISGVCGGIGEYFGVDPTLIRIIWILLTVLGGSGIVLYILALIIIPEAPIGHEPNEPQPHFAPPSADISLIIGAVLVGFGVWFLLRNLDIVPPQFDIVTRVLRDAFWPMILIIIGVLVILTAGKSGLNMPSAKGTTLYRSRTDRRVAGVAGGLAAYFGVDSTMVRIVFALLFILNFPSALLVYIVAAIIIPEQPA